MFSIFKAIELRSWSILQQLGWSETYEHRLDDKFQEGLVL